VSDGAGLEAVVWRPRRLVKKSGFGVDVAGETVATAAAAINLREDLTRLEAGVTLDALRLIVEDWVGMECDQEVAFSEYIDERASSYN
jgi:hypothetical protein